MNVFVIDNYDSFVYNLAQYTGEIANNIVVKRNDKVTIDDIRRAKPDRIIVSPGPGTPADPKSFGICTSLIRYFAKDVPILGVCLGHQGIVHAFGGRVVRAKSLRHGKTSVIRHDGRGVYRGIKGPFAATRYHSLVAQRRSLPDVLEISAESTDDREIMGVRHRDYNVEGVQFHPESILTTPGRQIISNFLEQ